MTPIAPYITGFLRDYLVGQRGASQHTRDSYAVSFQLLFTFASQELKRAPSDLSLEDMLHLAISAGLRVSEIIGLRMDDLSLQPPSVLVLPEVFVNSRDGELSRWDVAHILRKHVTAARKLCPSLQRKRVSPHVLRHTCAMTILRATNDLRKVSLWLGHSDMSTTEVYVRADPSEKLETVEAIAQPKLRRGHFKPTDKLLALLKHDSLCGAEDS